MASHHSGNLEALVYEVGSSERVCVVTMSESEGFQIGQGLVPLVRVRGHLVFTLAWIVIG